MQRLLSSLRLLESIVAALAYATVALLLMSDVIGREIFGQAILGTQQIAVYAAIIAGFLGLTLATSDNAHLRPQFMDFATRRIAARYEGQINRFGDALSALFFLMAAYVAWTFVAISMQAGDRAPVLYFPVWPLQLIIPYALASAGLKHALFALQPQLKPSTAAPAS